MLKNNKRKEALTEMKKAIEKGIERNNNTRYNVIPGFLPLKEKNTNRRMLVYEVFGFKII